MSNLTDALKDARIEILLKVSDLDASAGPKYDELNDLKALDGKIEQVLFKYKTMEYNGKQEPQRAAKTDGQFPATMGEPKIS